MKKIKSLFIKLGFNQAILFSLGLRGWQMIAGFVTLFLIVHFFTPTQQGFYYTFNSLLMLQLFFEMGLSYVLIQFTSHEFAYLRWGRLSRVIGGKKIQRFKELLSKSVRWYFLIAVFFLCITIPFGLYFLGTKDANAHFYWRLPFSLLVLATAINLFLLPFLASVEGSGQVREIYRLRFFQNFLATWVSWLVIILGGGLYNAVAIALTNAAITILWLIFKRPLLLRIAANKKISSISKLPLLNWRVEIWPMQWRIAISWISGYFINQAFVPILFYYANPVVAGQMGMSLSLSNMIVFIGQAWITTKAPSIGKIVAVKDWRLLDSTFYRLCAESCTVVFCVCVGLILIVDTFQAYPLFHRLLPPYQITLLCISAIITHCINCIAQYLRSHKSDPFMVVSVVGAILVAGSAWFFGKYYSSEGIVISVLVINLIYGLPTALWLWKKKRKMWHQPI